MRILFSTLLIAPCYSCALALTVMATVAAKNTVHRTAWAFDPFARGARRNAQVTVPGAAPHPGQPPTAS